MIVTVESSVFGKRAFQARYTVIAEPTTLIVEEQAAFGSLFHGPLYTLVLLSLGTLIRALAPCLAVAGVGLVGAISALDCPRSATRGPTALVVCEHVDCLSFGWSPNPFCGPWRLAAA